MNKQEIIGNLTRDPETHTTADGQNVCVFTVAVNRRSRERDETDFFRVSAWGKLGENCSMYLSKGKKVYVAGRSRANAYQGSDGEIYANIDITAEDVEFLSPKD